MRGLTGRTGAAIAGAVLACAGCTTSTPATTASSARSSVPSSASSSPSPSTADYRDLLLSAADIPVPGLQLKATSPGGATSQGAAAEFADSTGATAVTDVVSVFATTDDAGIALAAAVGVAPGQLDAPQARALTGGGHAYTGTSSGSAVTLAVFTVGRAFVTLRFQSDPSDPISADVVDQVVKAQTARLRAGLK